MDRDFTLLVNRLDNGQTPVVHDFRKIHKLVLFSKRTVFIETMLRSIVRLTELLAINPIIYLPCYLAPALPVTVIQ